MRWILGPLLGIVCALGMASTALAYDPGVTVTVEIVVIGQRPRVCRCPG